MPTSAEREQGDQVWTDPCGSHFTEPYTYKAQRFKTDLPTPMPGYFCQSNGQPKRLPTMLNDETKDRLRQRLNEVHEWPSVYMFKFIFEPDQSRLDAVTALFPAEVEMMRKYSAGGKYLSLTVREVMLSADEVVARYDRAALIQGVIVL